jgi:TATA-box binding protein (TBP) (component of TFIID and TFIIIB)
MDVQQEVQQRAKEFMTILNTSSNNLPITLSTMTVLVTLNRLICLETLANSIDNDNIQEFITTVTGNSANIKVSNKKRKFNNALVFNCTNIQTDHGTLLKKQAVKIFCNGKMHITGAKSTQDAIYIADVFASFMEIVCGGNGISGMFSIIDFNVQMINYYFKIDKIIDGKMLSLKKVHHILKTTTPYFSSYNSEHHAGVIIKAPMFSFLIFDSGNIIISLQNANDVQEAYRFVKEFFKAHLQICMINKPIGDKISKSNKVTKSDKKIKSFDYGHYLLLK